MTSKSAVIRQIILQLGRTLDNLAGASRTMHADASDEQNKAEDKYDTRALETAYLASSQARKATETEEALALYQSLQPAKFTDQSPIDLTALVELEMNGERIRYFIGPRAGGTEVTVAGKEILVITPESPLGKELMGKKAGDRVTLASSGPVRAFQVLSVR
jgi:transcription elongation GreA/GreB family factor